MEHIICWRFLAAAARESARGTRRPCRTDPPVVFIPATLSDYTGRVWENERSGVVTTAQTSTKSF